MHGEVAAALCIPVIATRASVVTLHGLNVVRRTGGVRARAAKANVRAVVRAANRTICVSSAELDEVLAIDARLGTKLMVIPNGVALAPSPTDAGRAAARAALGLEPASVVAIWIGALEAPKEPHVAVRTVVDLCDLCN